jgi:type IV pilus assembly protein PilQ
MRMKKTMFVFILLAACCMLFVPDLYAAAYQITDIELSDNVIKIKSSGPIRYKISRPDDPFRVIVDIEGAGIGKFKDKIYSRKAGITEITASQIETPALTSRLDILLQSPSGIRPESKGNTLTLYIEATGKTADKPASAAPPDKAKDKQEPLKEAKTEIKAGPPAKEIAAVLFDKTDDGIELVIKGDGIMPEPVVFELDGRLIIEIPDIAMKASLPSSIPSPVKDLKYKDDKDKVKFTLELEGKPAAEVFTLDDEVVVDIPLKPRKAGTAKKEDEQKAEKAETKEQKPETVSLDFQDADIVPILRLLGDVSGYNIVVHPEVKGKITMKLISVPWQQALDIILRTFTLDRVIEGNVIRIAPAKVFQEEKKFAAETKEIIGKAEDIETKVFVVNYAEVDKVRDAMDKAKVLSARGSVSTDARTRSLIVKDVPSRLEEVQKLIDTLDKATPQVLIDARIVNVSSNATKELGVEWGGWYSPRFGGTTNSGRAAISGSGGGTMTGLFPVTSFGDDRDDGAQSFRLSTLGTTNAPTGAITIGYLNPAQTVNLALRISALEGSGKGKTVSNPKIVTADNQKAVIKQGRKIPYSTVSQSGTQVQFVDASLDLIVTPQIGPGGTILLNIQVNNNEADFSRTSQGMPSIRTSEATTQVLVKDGETVVIGGILKTTESDDESAVPGLSKIPLLGWLFKRELKTNEVTEQLIFITPRVVKK